MLVVRGFVFAGMNGTVILSFEKVVKKDSRVIERVNGTIYLSEREEIFVKVSYPVNQLVQLTKFTNIFYYPEENFALIITYDRPTMIPFKRQFDIFAKDDMGLSEAGYSIEKSYKSNDILISVWQPPKKFEKFAGKIELGLKKDKICFNRVYSPKGELLTLLEFDNFTKVKGQSVPMFVRTTTFEKNVKKEEEINYSNIRTDEKFPEEVLNFKVPDNAKVKVIQW